MDSSKDSVRKMRITFPVEEATIRAAWVERGELIDSLVTLAVPMRDVPKAIRRRWATTKVNLTAGSKRDGDLVIYYPKPLGNGVNAPAVTATTRGMNSTPAVLLARLVGAIAESDKLDAIKIENRITEWFDADRPESLDRHADRDSWIEPPTGYGESIRVREIVEEFEARERYYQAWLEEQRGKARKLALDAKLEQERAEAAAVRSLESWREWAIGCGSEDLQAAIEDGYPVGGRIEREVAALLPQAPTGCEIIVFRYEVKGDRPVPNATARHVRAKLVEEANNLRDDLPPCTLDVSRIQRVILFIPCSTCGRLDRNNKACKCCPADVKCTGIIVTIQAPHLSKPIVQLYVVKGSRGDEGEIDFES